MHQFPCHNLAIVSPLELRSSAICNYNDRLKFRVKKSNFHSQTLYKNIKKK